MFLKTDTGRGVVSANSTFTSATFGALLAEDGTWSDDTVTYCYANPMRSAGASRRQEQLRYVYDAAGNLLHRTNHALARVSG